MQQIIYDPNRIPITSLKSAVHPSTLKDGEAQQIQNLRLDELVVSVRGGTTQLLAVPVANATLVDKWEGTLNGTHYIVAAYNVGTEVRVYFSTGSSWQELSEVGGWFGDSTGNTRFSTQTGRVLFVPVPFPRNYLSGSQQSMRDLLLVGDGEAYWRVWDPDRGVDTTNVITAATNATPIEITTTTNHGLNTGDTAVIAGCLGNTAANGSWTVTRVSATKFTLDTSVGNGVYSGSGSLRQYLWYSIHKPVTIPNGAETIRQVACFGSYWQVASSSGKTFASGGVLNQARYKLEASGTAPYSAGGDTCIQFVATSSAAASDIATVQFGAQMTLGRGLTIIVEDQTANEGADKLLLHDKIEINPDNAVYGSISSSWVTVYNPASSNAYESQAVEIPLDYDSTIKPRRMFWFPCDHISEANRSAYHIRFTRLGEAPTAATMTVTILGICGGGLTPGGSEFTVTYTDIYSQAESRPFVASDIEGCPLSQIGGPSRFSGTTPLKLPVVEGLFYDYIIPTAVNADASTTGGLDGDPNAVNLYIRLPDQTQAYYWFSRGVQNHGQLGAPASNGWQSSTTGMLNLATYSMAPSNGVYAIDWQRPEPSAFHITIPPAYASIYANDRLFTGDVKDGSGRGYGDIYFSARNLPFRMQSPVLSGDGGGHVSIAGERVQGFFALAAAGLNASYVFALTNMGHVALGRGSAFSGSGYDASEIGTVTRISKKGTNSPRTIAESDGVAYWVDQYSQVQEYSAGVPKNISRFSVDDKLKTVPASYRSQMSAAFFKDRYYLAYTPTGETTNTRILVYNSIIGTWESDDLPPIAAKRMGVFYDSSVAGSGQRLLVYGGTGAVYDYDGTGTTDLGSAVPIVLSSREYSRPDHDKSWLMWDAVVSADTQANTLTFARIYRNPAGTYSTTLSLNKTIGWVTDHGKVHTVTSAAADGKGERGRGVYARLSGNMTALSRLYLISVILKEYEGKEPVAG